MSHTIIRKLTITPDFREIDMMGVVHNCVYFEWFERGRLQIMNEVLPIEEARNMNVAIPVLQNDCRYENAVRFGDELTLITRHVVSDIYTGKIKFTHELINSKTRAQCAIGTCICSIMDMSNFKLIRVPAEKIWRRYLELK